MPDFEFQRYVTIGQYLATGSPLHRLDPRTRLLSGACLLIAVTAARHLQGLGLALGIALAALLIARVPLNYALRGLLAPLPFILFLAVLQMLIGPQAADAPALNLPDVRNLAGGRAERRHGFGGIDHVLGFEQPADPRDARRERTENQGAMRNRLVSGHAQAAV